MLSSVVTHASGNGSRSKITTAALTELRRAVSLFKEASVFGGRAGKFLVRQRSHTERQTMYTDSDVFIAYP